MDRIPPHDSAAERALIGSVMLSPKAYQPDVPASAFYSTIHGVLWDTLGKLVDAGKPTDMITLGASLNGHRDKITSRELSSLTNDAIPDYAATYAETVLECAARRQAIDAARKIVTSAYCGADAVELTAQFTAASKQITARDNSLRSIKDVTRSVVAELEELSKNGESPGWRTGFAELDYITRLHPGELTVVAGRPGMGKTAFALDLTRAALQDGLGVMWASLEMTAERLTKRLLSQLSGLEGDKFRAARFADSEWGKLFAAMGRLVKTNLMVDDRPGQSSGQIRAAAHRMAAAQPLHLVVVDYVQRIREPGDWANNKRLEIQQASGTLTNLAKELGCHVVLLSQLGRTVDARKPPIPQISDLKESGDLEQDADNILLLYREEYYRKADTPQDKRGMGEIHVGKCREGKTGVVDVLWNGPTTSYRPLERYR